MDWASPPAPTDNHQPTPRERSADCFLDLVRNREAKASGALRISCLSGHGRMMLMPVLQDFNECYPDILLDIYLTNELENLGGDQYDIIIRGGLQPGNRVVTRRLNSNCFVLAASPKYLANNGAPKTVQDLASHATHSVAGRMAYSNSSFKIVMTG
ncbi:LysR substrate-binding domain-containing protein [Pseudomonas sp. PA15(2017)]|uniref:LysR substrate-binding domain-containing protein n=1 Tax=Pseudomonas sp. PA15(2017) TaxID=1932111 RepID=UPI0035327BC6